MPTTSPHPLAAAKSYKRLLPSGHRGIWGMRPSGLKSQGISHISCFFIASAPEAIIFTQLFFTQTTFTQPIFMWKGAKLFYRDVIFIICAICIGSTRGRERVSCFVTGSQVDEEEETTFKGCLELQSVVSSLNSTQSLLHRIATRMRWLRRMRWMFIAMSLANAPTASPLCKAAFNAKGSEHARFTRAHIQAHAARCPPD